MSTLKPVEILRNKKCPQTNPRSVNHPDQSQGKCHMAPTV